MLCACNKDASEIGSLLNGIEAYIEEYPEEALKVLESVNREELTTRKLKAKHALLYSMALDKNYIDVTTDSIIAPAVNYYKYRGTDEERFKSLYYAGRVYQNAGNIEAAMEKFVEAEHHISNQIDKGIIARLYKAKMAAYQDVFDYTAAVSQANIAAKYYLSDDDTTRYLNAINDLVILYSQLDDYQSANKYLNILESNKDLMSELQLSTYYATYLSCSFNNSNDNIRDVLSDYLSVVTDDSIIKWLSVTNAYIILEDYTSAIKALNNYLIYGGVQDPSYYWTAATIYEGIGKYDTALTYYKYYQQSTDNTDMSIFESDTKFIEERYDAELKSVRQSLYIIIITLSLTIVVLVLIILAQRIKKRKKRSEFKKSSSTKNEGLLLEKKNRLKQSMFFLEKRRKRLSGCMIHSKPR